MGRDVLDVPQLVYHRQLGQDGQGLQPDAERPQEVHWVQGFVDDYGSEQGSSVQVVMGEGVCLPVQTEGEGLFDLNGGCFTFMR